MEIQQGFVLYSCNKEQNVVGSPLFISLDKQKVVAEQNRLHGLTAHTSTILEYPILTEGDFVYLLEYGHSFPLDKDTSKSLSEKKEAALAKLSKEDRSILGV